MDYESDFESSNLLSLLNVNVDELLVIEQSWRQSDIKRQFLYLLQKYGLKKDYVFQTHPLHIFLRYTEKEDNDVLNVAKIMLNNGVSINELNWNRDSALTMAIKIDHVELSSFLIENGANINQMNASHEFPLLLAAENGNIDIAEKLLLMGADVNGCSSIKGTTALHIACTENHKDMISYLLHKGAAVIAEDYDSKTPFSRLINSPFSLLVSEQDHLSSITAMIRTIVKLKYSNAPVSLSDLNLIKKNQIYQTISNSCELELHKMKETMILKSFSFYSFMQPCSSNLKLVNLLYNNEFVRAYHKKIDTFSLYQEDLSRIYQDAELLHSKIILIETEFKSVFGDLFPELVVRKIAQHLIAKDLPTSCK